MSVPSIGSMIQVGSFERMFELLVSSPMNLQREEIGEFVKCDFNQFYKCKTQIKDKLAIKTEKSSEKGCH